MPDTNVAGKDGGAYPAQATSRYEVFPATRGLNRAEDGVAFADGRVIVADQVHGLTLISPDQSTRPFGNFAKAGFRHDAKIWPAAPTACRWNRTARIFSLLTFTLARFIARTSKPKPPNAFTSIASRSTRRFSTVQAPSGSRSRPAIAAVRNRKSASRRHSTRTWRTARCSGSRHHPGNAHGQSRSGCSAAFALPTASSSTKHVARSISTSPAPRRRQPLRRTRHFPHSRVRHPAVSHIRRSWTPATAHAPSAEVQPASKNAKDLQPHPALSGVGRNAA